MIKLLYLLPMCFLVSFVPLSHFPYHSNPIWRVNIVADHPPSIMEECHIVEVVNHIPDHLLEALVLRESSGSANAVHHNGDGSIDIGPCQFNNRFIRMYADRFNYGRLFDPRSNEAVHVAGRALKSRYIELGSWRKAIASWNPGEKHYADHVYRVYYALIDGRSQI